MSQSGAVTGVIEKGDALNSAQDNGLVKAELPPLVLPEGIKGRKLPKLIQISKKDHSNDVYKTSKMIEKCRLCLTKLDPIRFTIHPTAMIMKTICVCGLTIVIRPANCFYF